MTKIIEMSLISHRKAQNRQVACGNHLEKQACLNA